MLQWESHHQPDDLGKSFENLRRGRSRSSTPSMAQTKPSHGNRLTRRSIPDKVLDRLVSCYFFLLLIITHGMQKKGVVSRRYSQKIYTAQHASSSPSQIQFPFPICHLFAVVAARHGRGGGMRGSDQEMKRLVDDKRSLAAEIPKHLD